MSNCYQHGTPWQQQVDSEPKEKQNTPKRVETRFKTRQLQHAPCLTGRDPKLRLIHQISICHFTMGIASFPEAAKLGARANKAIAALNRIAMSGTHVNTRCANKGKINRKTLREERKQHGSPNMDQHELSRTAGNKRKMCQKQLHWIRSRLSRPTQRNN